MGDFKEIETGCINILGIPKHRKTYCRERVFDGCNPSYDDTSRAITIRAKHRPKSMLRKLSWATSSSSLIPVCSGKAYKSFSTNTINGKSNCFHEVLNYIRCTGNIMFSAVYLTNTIHPRNYNNYNDVFKFTT